MTDSECGIIAAQWRILDGIDLPALLVNTHEAAEMIGVTAGFFLRLVRDEKHPLAQFFAPATWVEGPSGMRVSYQFWRHRIAVAAHVYRRMVNDIGGPVGFDFSPETIAAARTYAPDVVRGALVALETRGTASQSSNGTTDGYASEA